MCSCHFLYAMVRMDIISVLYCYYFIVRPDEPTEPPATSEKLEAGAVSLQKQSQKETKSSDDRQQAELILPSPGHNCNPCELSLCIDWEFHT